MLDQTRAQLKHQGFVQTTLSDPFKKKIAIAASAFQAQLAVFDKQPAQNRRAGFKRSARRQRLEVRQENDSLGQLGISQHVAVDVSATHCVILLVAATFLVVSLRLYCR